MRKNVKVGLALAAAAGGAAAGYYILTRPGPAIFLDDTNLVIGGYAVWNASGMDDSHVYVVGAILADGSLYYNPLNDGRVNSSSAEGLYALDKNMSGATFFVLYDVTDEKIVASVPITVAVTS